MPSRSDTQHRQARAARITAAVSRAALVAALLAGCRAGTSFHGTAEIAQWTPALEADAVHGGYGLDLVSTGGMGDNDALWAFDVALRAGRASRRGLTTHTYNLGYMSHQYSGRANLTNVNFGNVTLDGDTSTSLDLNLYKFSYGEPQAATGGRNNRTEGTLGLQYLDFTAKCVDADGTTARYAGNAPMFVIGWKIAYTDRAVVYFASIEWMDLDIISLENVKGEVLDYQAGFRWSIGTSAALSLGYRDYLADLKDRGEKLKIQMAGAFFSLFIMW